VMLRRMFSLASLLSLLLCLATVVLWVRSYAASNSVGLMVEAHTLSVTSVSGRIVLGRTNNGLLTVAQRFSRSLQP
jgi:hypothetical protein